MVFKFLSLYFLFLLQICFLNSPVPEPKDSYFFPARYYDPKIGRFISPDIETPGGFHNPLGLNRYAYVFNSPLKYSDPDGHAPQDPSQSFDHDVFIPRRKKVPGIPFRINRAKEIIGNRDYSQGLIYSNIAIAHTQKKHVEHFIAETQKTLGDQGTLLALPFQGETLSFKRRNGAIVDVDFYLLAMQPIQNPRPNSKSYELSKQLENLFNLTTRPDKKYSDRFPASLILGDSQVNPFYAGGGGGRTFSISNATGQSASAIYLDVNSQAMLPMHQGPPTQIPLGITAVHEMIGHVKEIIETGQALSHHNTLAQDLKGDYDPGNWLDNNLIIPAYNENIEDPNNKIPERSHYHRKGIPQARQILDSTLFRPFRAFQKKE